MELTGRKITAQEGHEIDVEELRRAIRRADGKKEDLVGDQEIMEMIYKRRTKADEREKDGSRAWKHWTNWVDEKLPDVILGRHLQAVRDLETRQKWAAMYIGTWVKAGEVEEQITRRVTALRANFRNHGKDELGKCWESDMMDSVRRTARRTTEQAREKLFVQARRKKWDVNMRLMYELAVDLGAFDGTWDERGMMRKGMFLGAAMMFEFGARPSNQSHGKLKEQDEEKGHAWRYEDIKLVVDRRGEGNAMRRENWQGGKEATRMLVNKTIDKKDVTFIGIARPTDKMTSRKASRQGPQYTEPAYIGRRTELESWLLDFLLEWLINNGERSGTDLIFERKAFPGTRGKPGRKAMVKKSHIVNALKDTVMRLGLGKEHFSAGSFRKGYMTNGRNGHLGKMQEEALETVIQRGQNWAPGSLVPKKHYLQEYAVEGPFGLTESWEVAKLESLDKYRMREVGQYEHEETGSAE